MADTTHLAPDLLVLGGSGLLGRQLLAFATSRSLSWAATHLTAMPTLAGSWHQVDLADGGSAAAELIIRLNPAAVINAAYIQKGPDLSAVTAQAPGAVAGAVASTGARLVHISSDVVFDGTTEGAYVEDDAPAPVNDYARAKARAEQLVADADPTAVVVRTSLLWGGVGDGGAQIHLVKDPDISFFTDEIRNPLRVDRLAAACLELADRSDIEGVLHVAGADALNRLEFARLLAPLVGREAADLRGGSGDQTAARPRNCPLDSSKARGLLKSPLPGVGADTADIALR